MKILILGSTGMLGHQLLSRLSAHFETWGTLRQAEPRLAALPNVNPARLIAGVDAQDFPSVMQAVATVRPTVVINCVGLIKQRESGQSVLPALELNARFPHLLADLCQASGARLIHISTDCVFTGARGNYTESDPTDAADVYGKTKALGEVTHAPHALTLRTSLIGRELTQRRSLVEWFLGSQASVKGFQRAIFSGFPTDAIADILQEVVLPRPELHGLYHLAAPPISKHALLLLLREAYAHPIEIIPDDAVHIDRSLDGTRFQQATGFQSPDWPSLVQQMAQVPIHYTEGIN
ncbi:MAG: SDR family oxidoreductase [Anaerolineae bacterium]|nr:SDR family oxidoreductase [Anaerolineae bacterium]